MLEDIIRYGKTERMLLHEMTNELLEFVDYEPFVRIYNNAGNFPDLDDIEHRTYQASSFIGYLKGIGDTLDAISQHLKYSFIEFDENHIKECSDDEG